MIELLNSSFFLKILILISVLCIFHYVNTIAERIMDRIDRLTVCLVEMIRLMCFETDEQYVEFIKSLEQKQNSGGKNEKS